MYRERSAVLYTERLCLRAMTEADEKDALLLGKILLVAKKLANQATVNPTTAPIIAFISVLSTNAASIGMTRGQ